MFVNVRRFLDERQSGIVILEIEGISHSRGHLINEAENAVVGAGAVIVHQVLGKFHAQVFFVFLLSSSQISPLAFSTSSTTYSSFIR